MDILGSAVGIILAIVVAVIIYFLLKKVVALIINAIVGIILLFLLNLFHVMAWFGASDLPDRLDHGPGLGNRGSGRCDHCGNPPPCGGRALDLYFTRKLTYIIFQDIAG